MDLHGQCPWGADDAAQHHPSRRYAMPLALQGIGWTAAWLSTERLFGFVQGSVSTLGLRPPASRA